MSILAWIVLGLIAGFVGSKIVNRTGEGLVLDLALGIVGAVVGGFLFNLFVVDSGHGVGWGGMLCPPGTGLTADDVQRQFLGQDC